MPTLELPHLYPAQRAAIFTDARIACVEASTKAGKTVGAIAWLLAQAWTRGAPGRHFAWVAPTYGQAEIARRRVVRMLTEADKRQDMWRPLDAEHAVVLESGGRIDFKGSDRPDTLFGEDNWAAVVDEASRCREEAWHAVRSTLTATRGPCVLIGNVRGRRNWFYQLARMAEAGEPDMAHARLTARDAVIGGVLSLDEVRQAKRQLPAHVFAELFMARANDDGGCPFGLEQVRACTMPNLAAGPPVAWGIDLAKSSDWTVCVGLNEFGQVCAFQRWQGDWKQTTERVAAMVGMADALADQTGVGNPIVELLRGRCPNLSGFTFTSTSKQALMEGLAMAVGRGDVAFPEGRIVAELEAFEYHPTRTGVRYEAPPGHHDDCVDALALAVECWNRQHRVGAPTLTVLGGWDGDEDDDEAGHWVPLC